MTQIAMRLPVELLERVDRYAEKLKAETQWATVTRADALRALLVQGLGAVEPAGRITRNK